MHVPAAEFHLDASHARLDEPPREQAAEPEGRVAVPRPRRRLLPRDVEGLEVDAPHEPHGVAIELVVGLELRAAVPLLEVAVDPVGEGEPPLEVLFREVAGTTRVLEARRRVGDRDGRDRRIQ